ncbi:MAG: hypothetical protein K8R41_06915, partial [Bacteroidales bacterium]|nr:hypothetical protein [Bacteroidales bacterium]
MQQKRNHISKKIIRKQLQLLLFSVIVFMLFFPSVIFSQTHYFKCISVENNNDITLSWTSPVAASDFISYNIFHTTSSNPYVFTEICVITNYSTNTYIDLNTNANFVQNFYFIETKTNEESVISDTLHSIRLRVMNFANGKAELDWNPVHNPSLPGYSDNYQIFRKYSFGDWELIGTTQNIEYDDIISVCNDTINYYVSISDESGCLSTSNIAGDWLQDINKPPVPTIDSVSINSENKIIIGWEENTAKDTEAYILYHFRSGTWNTLDTIWGIENTFYTDTLSEPCNSTYSYSIAAFDSCGNTSPFGINPANESDSLRNIYFKNISFNPCNNSISLNWTEYINMSPSLAGYEIYISKNGNPFTLLEIIPSSSTSYDYESPDNNSDYTFFIRAFNPERNKTSTSCQRSVQTFYPHIPQFNYLRYATIVNNESVKLKIFADTTRYAAGYKILRSETETGIFETLTTLPHSISANFEYFDNSAFVTQKSYYYKIIVLDSCENEILASNHARTILLTAKSNPNNIHHLEWNEYEEWDGQVDSYNVYRKINGIQDSNPIAMLPYGTTEYDDDVNSVLTSGQEFSYFIEAIEGIGFLYSFNDTSRSNEAFVSKVPKIFMPNAFAPKGLNNKFTPITT